MAYIEPNTDVYLLKDIKITPNYSDTIFFATKAAQEAYFSNAAKRVATLSKNSYQRYKRGWMKVGLPCGTVSQANYMMFKNTSFENKWFYAFITDWEYLNNGTTLISYMIDDMQTWFFDCRHGSLIAHLAIVLLSVNMQLMMLLVLTEYPNRWEVTECT